MSCARNLVNIAVIESPLPLTVSVDRMRPVHPGTGWAAGATSGPPVKWNTPVKRNTPVVASCSARASHALLTHTHHGPWAIPTTPAELIARDLPHLNSGAVLRLTS
jgi:hypothetical protein